MTGNILITGASGYIGGTLVADFFQDSNPIINSARVIAAVRTTEYFEEWIKLGAPVVQVDLQDEKAVAQTILENEIDIIIHAAGSFLTPLAINLINALAQRRNVTGRKTYMIQLSGLSAFYRASGWKHKNVKDTDDVFTLEKEIADSWPVRQTDIAVIEHAEAQDVELLLILPPIVYGRGRGVGMKQSPVFTGLITAALQSKAVHKFADEQDAAMMHLDDLSSFFSILVQHILQDKPLATGKEGYYFTPSHYISWWNVNDCIAEAMHGKGLVDDPKAQVWASDEDAAKAMGMPATFVKVMINSCAGVIGERPAALGWKPVKGIEVFRQSMGDEVDLTIENNGKMSSLTAAISNVENT